MKLYLEHTDYIYVRVQSLIWLFNGLRTPSNLESKAADQITEIYDTVFTDKLLILDFYHVESRMDRCLEQFIQAIEKSEREVAFINIQQIEYPLYESISEHYSKKLEKNSINTIGKIFVMNPVSDSSFYETIYEKIESLIDHKIHLSVKSIFRKFDVPQYLHSTPYLTTGVFDASKLIQNREAFLWTSLKMAKKVDDIIENYKLGSQNKEIRLLSVSLRSSPFAASIALLNNLSIQTIDHLGPKHKVFDLDILESFQKNRSFHYIYIGDFCLGGTEIKIAQTYANLQSSSLEHAVVIGSLFERDIFKDNFELHSLISLKNIHPDAKFTIHL